MNLFLQNLDGPGRQKLASVRAVYSEHVCLDLSCVHSKVTLNRSIDDEYMALENGLIVKSEHAFADSCMSDMQLDSTA